MRTLQQLRMEFLQYKIGPTDWLGDSPSRFDFYTEIASDCDSILELGVYTGLTTTAFMLARPKRLVSVDISDEHFHLRHELRQAARELAIDFEFRIADDLVMEPSACDLLFIDTTHTYEQTLAELRRYGPLARKKIVLHDMTTPGVYQAVFQWLWDNRQFRITHHDSRGCGVVVCERYAGHAPHTQAVESTAQDEHAVCVAINDNDRAWYEMLVPFLLSLRSTGYGGRIAVISYGLSAQKRQILERESVDVIEASGNYSLPLGRFIEAADYCARHPGIRKLALYDADIWFCSPEFDLFSRIGDNRMHVCADSMLCTFITEPLIGERRDHHRHQVTQEVLARHGAALQAGLLAGTADAWTRFAAHVRDCITRIGTDFQERYGLDTTFLHLWSAQGETALLDPVQNFVSKHGVHEAFRIRDGSITLTYRGEPIRALHMTGDIRFFDRWRYYTNHAGAALRDGAPFALSDGTPVPSETIATDIGAADYLRSAGILVTAAALEPSAGAYLQVVNEPGGTMLVGSGNHEISFTATRAMERLHFYINHPSGSPSPLSCEIFLNGEIMHKSKDLATHLWAKVAAGSIITLRSTSLGGQQCNVNWRLRETSEMHQ